MITIFYVPNSEVQWRGTAGRGKSEQETGVCWTGGGKAYTRSRVCKLKCAICQKIRLGEKPAGTI